MANRWCDGFGRYGGVRARMLNGSSSQAWAEVSSSHNLSTANPRTGTHCLSISGAGASKRPARRVFGEPLQEVLVGFALYATELPSLEPSLTNFFTSGVFLPTLLDQANRPQLSFVLGTDGAIVVYRGMSQAGSTGFSGTLLGRTVPVIGAGAYQHVEIYSKAGNGTDGAFEIRVDEVTKLNLTGIDTIANSSVEFSQVEWGIWANAEYGRIDIADAYVNDTVVDGSGCHDFIGDCKSGTLMVNGDTAQADFDLSAGELGYTLLNERPPDDGTYISTEDEAARSDYELEDGPANLTEILTVRPFVRAWKDDAGTCLIAPSMASDGDVAVVAEQPVATAPSYYDSNVPLDPDTDAPWTPEALNAALEVVERIDEDPMS